MKYKFLKSEFDVTGFLRGIDCYVCDGDSLEQDIEICSCEELAACGGQIVRCIDIFSANLPLEDYALFSNCSEDDSWEDYLDEDWEEERDRILALAKEKKWEPDGNLAMAIDGDGAGVAARVTLAGDYLKIEPGYAVGGSERSSSTFEESGFGMAEIEKMVKKEIEFFRRKGAGSGKKVVTKKNA